VASINKPKKNNDAIINDDIRCKEMLVITNTGEKLGVLPKRLALQAASDRGLDLVLVSPEASPAVAKIMDYSKFRFEQQKKAKEMKKSQKIISVQEIRLSPVIEQNDLMTKSRNARKILEKGNKVKVSLRFYGRMIAHQEIGEEVMKKFVETLADCSQQESSIKLDGKSLFTVLGPKNDK
jgi:translation initiation factor IF-3